MIWLKKKTTSIASPEKKVFIVGQIFLHSGIGKEILRRGHFQAYFKDIQNLKCHLLTNHIDFFYVKGSFPDRRGKWFMAPCLSKPFQY